MIFAALGLGLWFAFPDLRASSVGKDQENNLPVAASDADFENEQENISSIPPLETEPPAPPQDDEQQPTPLSNYPLAAHSWGDIFNPQQSVPSHGYFAWYINTNQPKQVVGRETVNNITINYPFDRFLGIPSEDFGAYWAGRLHVPQRGAYRISADISWAKMRVLLNRHIIAEAENSVKDQTILLEPGNYLLEVEYINNWHTTGFQLAVAPKIEEIDSSALSAILAAKQLPAQTVTYAVGVYESDNRDNRLILQAPAGNTPYILILSSYHAVHWSIQGRAPQLVIYNNADSGSTVSTVGNVMQIAWSGQIPFHITNQKASNCYCTAAEFHCEYRSINLRDFAANIRQLTGFPLKGFSGKYSANYLPIPQTVIDAASIADNARSLREIEQARQACTKRNNAGFEEMMQH
ncbi:hypothetical protein [Eikenella glucosivorans]|uniref:hypothetical protein n=1 Tax=Eikenella glucosivorans TaxID=2766967 RepID=UPI0019651725|nr:hypothetical protein [Eikenella glucosivorans]